MWLETNEANLKNEQLEMWMLRVKLNENRKFIKKVRRREDD